MATEVRALQRTTRQSPYKMRLVIDQIRGKDVNQALALLKFSKKHAAREIAKVLNSAVANAEHKARTANNTVDVDMLYVKRAIINEGPKLKRFTPAAMGRATQVLKRTSHVEIVVSEREKPVRAASATPKKSATAAAPKQAAATKATAKSAKPKASAKAKSAKPTSKKESE
jgi:large subunit ribosomal protein L22